jgi:phosphonate transport system substrate-binding protein
MKLAACLALWLLSCCVCPAIAGPGTERPDETVVSNNVLHLGIVPFTSTTMLLKIHRPLRDHLSRVLGRTVHIYTSTNHEQFLNDALEGRFDIVVTTAHFLPMLIDGNFVALVRYRNPLEFVLVVRNDSDIHQPKDLRGRRVGLPDRFSLFYIAGMQWMNDMGMEVDVAYHMVEQTSHLTALLSVDAGWIDAAVTAGPLWLQLDADIRARLRLVDTGVAPLPAMMTLAHHDLGEETVAKIREALLAFPDTPEGKQFFATAGYGGYLPATPADIDGGKVFERLMRRLWEKRPPAPYQNHEIPGS